MVKFLYLKKSLKFLNLRDNLIMRRSYANHAHPSWNCCGSPIDWHRHL